MAGKNISIIVAVAENMAIGKDNKLLWHLSDDLKRFKKITDGHKVIMGRNTFLSLPNGPLPNRKNMVITDNRNESFDGCETYYSIDQLLESLDDQEEVFIIGGGMIYKQFLNHARRIYLTKVPVSIQGDTYFPEIKKDEWDEISREDFPASERNEFPHSFLIMERKRP